MAFPEWGNSYNALHVPLTSDWQCALVPAREVQDVDRGWKLSYEATFTTMRPDTTSPSLAHATFIISGDSVSPDFWSRYFGVTPNRSRTKGERYRYPSGKLSARAATSGYWAVQSESAVRSDQLAPHLCYLKSALALPRVDFADLLREQRAKAAIWCYWMNDTGDRVPDVPDDIRVMMEAMGGTVELDEYR